MLSALRQSTSVHLRVPSHYHLNKCIFYWHSPESAEFWRCIFMAEVTALNCNCHLPFFAYFNSVFLYYLLFFKRFNFFVISNCQCAKCSSGHVPMARNQYQWVWKANPCLITAMNDIRHLLYMWAFDVRQCEKIVIYISFGKKNISWNKTIFSEQFFITILHIRD